MTDILVGPREARDTAPHGGMSGEQVPHGAEGWPVAGLGTRRRGENRRCERDIHSKMTLSVHLPTLRGNPRTRSWSRANLLEY